MILFCLLSCFLKKKKKTDFSKTAGEGYTPFYFHIKNIKCRSEIAYSFIFDILYIFEGIRPTRSTQDIRVRRHVGKYVMKNNKIP